MAVCGPPEELVTTSLKPILAPRSIALAGVSSRPDSLSIKLLDNLIASGFRGDIFPVNPRSSSIRELPCFPSVAAIGTPVDLAVLMVPRHLVMPTVEECLQAHVGGVVVITAGFREGGEAGAALERELVGRLRARGVRMVGPNCMGVINTAPEVRLDATFSPTPALAGPVAFASHSGALGVAVLEAAAEAGLGFSQFVSVGNGADVNVNDVLEFWEQDERTRAVMLYLESLDEPRRFLEVSSRLSARMPVIALKAGRSAAGQRAASSHTGALAAADTAVDAVFAQAGVLRVATLSEMFDVALAAQGCPAPRGRRVAVVTNAGGPAIVAADALAQHGLELAALAEATQEEIRSFLPPEASVSDPVDMLPSARAEDYRRALGLVLADQGVDAAVAIAVTPPQGSALEVADAIASQARESSKPVVSVFMTAASFFPQAHRLPGMPPVYRYPEWGVRSLAALTRHAARSSARAGEVPVVSSPTLTDAVACGHDGYLSQADAFAVLEEIGVSVAPWRVAPDVEAAEAAAAEIGFPVVLKGEGTGLVHKSELGAVQVSLTSRTQVREAGAAIVRRLEVAGIGPGGFLVQRMIASAREVILGATRDPAVGPLLMVGLGGVAVEVWKDVVFRPAPVTPGEVDAMLQELRGAPLLGVFRGRPAGDLASLCDAAARLAALAAVVPQLAECDINPLLVLDEGRGCVAVDVRLRLTR